MTMSRRYEDLSPQELASQEGFDRSWVNAQRSLADPAFRSYLEESIERVNGSRSAATLSQDDFLTGTESSDRVGPLRAVGEYHAWIERESPTTAARRVARAFIAELGDQPWWAPSVPIAELSSQPEYEIRAASLAATGENDVQIWYLHAYATGNVDLISVTDR